MKNKLKTIALKRKDFAKSQSRKYSRSKFGNFIMFCFLFIAGAYSVIPLVYSIATSFKPLDELMIFPPTLITVRRPTLENYSILPELISNLSVPLSRYAANSIFISLVGTVFNVITASMAAFVLSKGGLKHRKIIFLTIQFSLLFNSYTLEVPRYLIYAELRAIDTYWVYLLPFIASAMGVFLVKQYIDGYIPDALIEAAHIDGAGWFKIFWRIIFPNIRPCVLTLILFTFRDLWATIPSGTIFSENLKTLPTVMSTIASGGIARSGASMAASVIMMIPPIAVYLVSQSSIKETMGSAGIKG